MLDYPGRVAALVFFGGCNLSCSYCHNPSLVRDYKELPSIPEEDLLGELERRKKLIEGVVITGGEPTLNKGLVTLCGKLQDMGLLVKLDTNGLNPKILEVLLKNKLVDFVAMDIKTAPERYDELHDGPVAKAHLARSAKAIIDSGVEHEFRTTVVPGLVSREDVDAMGEIVRGAQNWAFQQYVSHHALCPSMQNREPFPIDEVRAIADMANTYAKNTFVRGQ